jgi:hypothetical protein
MNKKRLNSPNPSGKKRKSRNLERKVWKSQWKKKFNSIIAAMDQI